MRALLLAVASVAFVGCTFGANTCDESRPCSGGATCEQGFCVTGTTGGGGGTMGGGGGTTGGGMGGGGGGMGGGGGGGGAPTSYCDAGLSCAGWQECLPTSAGGDCADAEYQVSWITPANNGRFNTSPPGRLSVTKRDGGTGRPLTVPVRAVELGSTLTFNPASGDDFDGTLTMMNPDGPKNFIAGWEEADAGRTASIVLDYDTTAPAFSVVVVNAPSYADDAGFFGIDPDAQPGGLPLVKKDETVTLELRSSNVDVALGSVSMSLHAGGVVWDAGVGASCGSAAFCRAFTLALGPQPMAAFTQELVANITGADDASNLSTLADAGVLFATRWKWARQVTTNELKAAPVIAASGDLYLGGRGAGGGVFRVTPLGASAQVSSAGPVEAGLAISRDVSGAEAIFFMTTNGGIQTLDGGVAACVGGGSNTGNVGSLGVLNDGTNMAMGVGVVGGNADLTGRQLRGLVGGATCLASSGLMTGAQGMAYPGNVITNGNDVWYAASDGTVRRFSLVATAFNVGTTVNGLGAGSLYGISLFSAGATLAGGGGGAGTGRLFVKASDNSGTVTGYDTMSHVTGVAVGAGSTLFAVTQASDEGTLRRFDASGNVQAAAVLPGGVIFSFPSGSIPGATTPVLGNGNWVYATANDGLVVAAEQTSLAVRWTKPLPLQIGGQVFASPTLDCNRTKTNTGTGIHYVATTTGWVVAYITDSPGLDLTAPWPKYQHDARNTGAVGTSVACGP